MDARYIMIDVPIEDENQREYLTQSTLQRYLNEDGIVCSSSVVFYIFLAT
jgi:hypothetical protein